MNGLGCQSSTFSHARLGLVTNPIVIWNIFIDVQLYERESSESLFGLIPALTMLVDSNMWIRKR
jgi:hypothetical protein